MSQAVLDAVSSQTETISAIGRFVHEHPSSATRAGVLALPLRHARGGGARGGAWRGRHGDSLPRDTHGREGPDDRLRLPLRRGRSRTARRSYRAVHSCGHGPIAGGVTGAALALSGAPREPGRHGCRDRLPRRRDPRRARSSGAAARRSAPRPASGTVSTRLCTRIPSSSTPCRSNRAGCAARRLSCLGHGVSRRPRPPHMAAEAALEVARAHVPDNIMLERLEYDGDVEEATGLVTKAHLPALRRRRAGGRKARPCGERSRTRPGSSAPLRGGAPRRACHGCRGSGVPDARSRLRRGPAPASVRDRLRQYLAPLPGCAHRHRPAGRLGVSHRRGAAEFASPAADEAALTIAQVLALAAVELCHSNG